MEGDGTGAIPLPERLDRPARFGPFPSGTDALKFLLAAATGALVAVRLGAVWWLPFLAGGLVLSAHRSDQPPIDDRLLRYARWRLRRHHLPVRGRSRAGHAVVRRADGSLAAGLEAQGLPVAYRPPESTRALYDAYRQLLRHLEATIVLEVGRAAVPMPPLPAVPPAADADERAARSGYEELVHALVRRRSRRVVRLLLLGGPAGRPGALRSLEEQLTLIQDTLAAVEVPCRRLAGAELLRALGDRAEGEGSGAG